MLDKTDSVKRSQLMYMLLTEYGLRGSLISIFEKPLEAKTDSQFVTKITDPTNYDNGT